VLGVNPEDYIRRAFPELAAVTDKTSNDLVPHDLARLQLRPRRRVAFSMKPSDSFRSWSMCISMDRRSTPERIDDVATCARWTGMIGALISATVAKRFKIEAS
jgi:hypothetical protein